MATRTYCYDLGRARGACYGRKEPTERDWDWLCEQPGSGEIEGDLSDAERQDFEEGMLDGAEHVETARLGVVGVAPPSAESIAAARDR